MGSICSIAWQRPRGAIRNGLKSASLIVLLGHSPLAMADHGGSTPHEPMGLSVPSNSSTGDYSVTWTVGTRQLQERKVGGYSYTTIYEGTSPKSFTNKGDGTYYYRLRKQFCKWSECTWYYSEPEIIVVSNVTPPGKPGPIQGPSTVYYPSGSAQYTLTWAKASGSVGEYQLRWRKDGENWGTIHASSNQQPLVVTDGTYEYRVAACNDAGCSAFTAIKTVEVIYMPLPGVPGAISGESSVPSADNSATYTLTWGEASGTVEDYKLERRIANLKEDWQSITPTTPRSRTEVNLPYGTYHYQVKACNSSGCSAYTDMKTVQVVYLALPGAPGAISGPPSFIDATGNGATYTLGWAEASGTVDTYKLQRKTSSSDWSTIRNNSSRTIEETRTAGTYQYRVSACNGSGCGAYTATKSVQVVYQLPPGVPGAISGPSTVYDPTGSGASYSLDWDDASGVVASYTLQRNSGQGWLTIEPDAVRPVPQNMTEGTYQYRVAACNSSGCSAYTAIKSVEVIYLPPPGVPGDISGPGTAFDTTGNGASYTLAWGKASGTVSRYELQKDGSTVQSGGARFINDTETVGTYDYKVRACNVSGCGLYTAVKAVDVVTAIAGDPPNITPSAVGTTPYGIDVAGDGDAIVTIPLDLIDGIAGFAPALWLEYDSGRGVDRLERSLSEDTIGYGWRLAGLSHIRRCVVNQSSAAAIQLDSGDSLCLNGMPLVRASGSHLAVGAIYRTLLESYIRIEVKGSTGALWFEATLPDGTVQEYGRADGSRVDINGGIDYQWSINKAIDVDGNVITYTWHRDIANGINYIASIAYAGAGVEFEYSPRTDTDPVSIDGVLQEQSVLLHTVRVRVNGDNVREYFLFNEEVDGRRRLDKIQQCGYDEGGLIVHCLKPLDFAWTTSGATIPGVPVLVSGMTDGLGASQVVEYGTITDGSEVFLFSERPFGTGALAPDTQLLPGSGARRFVATKLRRDNGLGGCCLAD